MSLTMDMVIYLLGLAATAGAVLARIGALEKKVDALSGTAERTTRLEEWRGETDRRMTTLETGLNRTTMTEKGGKT